MNELIPSLLRSRLQTNQSIASLFGTVFQSRYSKNSGHNCRLRPAVILIIEFMILSFNITIYLFDIKTHFSSDLHFCREFRFKAINIWIKYYLDFISSYVKCWRKPRKPSWEPNLGFCRSGEERGEGRGGEGGATRFVRKAIKIKSVKIFRLFNPFFINQKPIIIRKSLQMFRFCKTIKQFFQLFVNNFVRNKF